MTRTKILIFLLLISSFFGYLEWSGDNHTYLFQAEADILLKLFTDPASVLHPFIMLPLLGQIILSITFFQKKPKRILMYIGIVALSVLFGFILFIGLLSGNLKIVSFSLPFLSLAVITVLHTRK